jgi:hypothetical protein
VGGQGSLMALQKILKFPLSGPPTIHPRTHFRHSRTYLSHALTCASR